MNSEQKPKSLHVQHGHGCSIVWHEPVRADGCDNRRIKATCLRRLPLNGVAYWDIVVDLDGEKFVDMVLCRNSRTYAVEIARATISAIKNKACHARRNRKNRKARRNAESEAVIAETVARQMVGADDEFWDDFAMWDWRLSDENNMWRTPDQLLELKAADPEAARILAEKIMRDPALRRPHQLG